MENQTTNQTENKFDQLEQLIVEHANATKAFNKKLIGLGFNPSLIYILSVPTEGSAKGDSAFSMAVEGHEVGLFKAFLKGFKHGENLDEIASAALVGRKLMGGR